MIRDLLVHVDGSEAGRRRLRFAIDLALRTGARLNGLHVMPPPEVPPLYKPSQVDEATANMSLKLASNARAARKVFNEDLGASSSFFFSAAQYSASDGSLSKSGLYLFSSYFDRGIGMLPVP